MSKLHASSHLQQMLHGPSNPQHAPPATTAPATPAATAPVAGAGSVPKLNLGAMSAGPAGVLWLNRRGREGERERERERERGKVGITSYDVVQCQWFLDMLYLL